MAHATLYAALKPEDMALTGPDVWPKIMADHAVDRFIFRRPELAYIIAKKRMVEKRKKKQMDPEAGLMGIRLRRIYYLGGKREEKWMQRWGHQIIHEDEREDIKRFLEDLRRILNRTMPDKPLVNCSIQLRFYDFDAKTDELLSWQERWL